MDEGVFKYLSQERRSIVKSLNPTLFAPGRNPNWEDCLSGAICKSFKDGKYPILTFGISVKYAKIHKQLLYFLSFIRFEELIFSVVERFEIRMQEALGNHFNIMEVLKSGKNQ